MGGRRREGRRSIAWTMMKRVENKESTQLHGFARWRGKKYSYWLSCTHITPKISTILPYPSSNLKTREPMTIAGVGTIFAT